MVTHYTLANGQYLADVATLDALPTRCVLDAPTGTGKSTLATQGERVVLAVSTQLAAEQLHLKMPTAVGLFHGSADIVTGNMRVIAVVYDSLSRLLERYSFIDETWALVIDEQHNLALASYRLKALDRLLAIAHGRVWRQVVFMSGTPLDMPHGRDYERVTVRRATQRTQPAVFVNYESGHKLAVAAQIAHTHVAKGERVLIYLNSKNTALNRLQGELAARGVSGIYTLNADNKLEQAGRAVIETEQLPQDCNVLITTAVLVESANLLTDIGAAIIASPIHPAYAQQFVSRARNNAPMCYILNNGIGAGYGIDTRAEIANILGQAEKLGDLLNSLARPWDNNRANLIAGQVSRLVSQDDSGAWAASLLGVLQHVTQLV
ncbi:MAG: hypothetical protein KDD89_14055, partial [Anaerolineales bacterium]|nr:hypothetical protein [Anaerolineales bacterium]